MSSLYEILRGADRAATLAVNNFDSLFTDAVMPVLSNRYVWIPLYALLIAFLWKRFGLKKTLVIVFAVVLSVVAIDQIANIVKYAVQRYRPCWDPYMTGNGLRILEHKGGKYGFFSAHAATTSGIATAVMYFVKEHWGKGVRFRILAWCFVFYVVGVSISRVYVGKHFLGDIIVGAAVGVLVARAISWAVRKVVTKYFAKFVD